MLTEAVQNTMQPSAHHVRLLMPFFMDRDALPQAKEVLTTFAHAARKSWACWEKPDIAKVPLLYRDETLVNVYSFLFGDGGGSCAYFKIPDETANFWFKNGGTFTKLAESAKPDTSGRPVSFDVSLAAPGIELFLSPHGGGVFSVTFTPKHNDDPRYLQELNYRLSQVREFSAYPFRLPHSPQNPNQPPARDAPLTERLGQAGGAFTLMEWVDFLLKPLCALNYRPMQQQFSVYSVTRFGATADFTDSNTQAALRPYLAAVAHVEEYHHVGSLEMSEQVLNPRHWAAVGSLGAGHLVADQNQPPRDFDEQRLAVSLHKYFTPYLLGFMQRIILQGIIEDARNILISRCAEAPDQTVCKSESLRRLNLHTLMFTVNGWFTETSSREVINQYYALAQRGLRVQDCFQTVQRALLDAEAMDSDRFQNDTLRKMGELAEQAADVQTKVEWLEVFFVSYYATALVYYISHDNTLFEHSYATASLIVTPFVSGLIAFFSLNPHKPHSHDGQDKTGKHRKKNSSMFLVVLVLAFFAWLVVGGFIGLENSLLTPDMP